MGAVTAEGVLERFAQVAGLAEEEAAASPGPWAKFLGA